MLERPFRRSQPFCENRYGLACLLQRKCRDRSPWKESSRYSSVRRDAPVRIVLPPIRTSREFGRHFRLLHLRYHPPKIRIPLGGRCFPVLRTPCPTASES